MAYHLSFWKVSPQCTLPQLKKELFIDVQKVILNNILKFTQGIMVQFIKLGPIPSSMMLFWLALQTGAANFGTGGEIHLSILSKALTFTIKSSILNGVLTNPQFLLQWVKTAVYSSGKFIFIQGFVKEKHAWSHLHC